MSSKYYYTIKGKRLGPVMLDELKSLAASGVLTRSDLLWTEGMAAWQPAGLTVVIFEGLPPDLETGVDVNAPLVPDEINESNQFKHPPKSVAIPSAVDFPKVNLEHMPRLKTRRLDDSDKRLVVAMSVVALLILGAIMWSYGVETIKERAKQRAVDRCINNLRQIDAAAQQWALEHGKRDGDHIDYPNDLKPYLSVDYPKGVPLCPDGGVYILNKVGDKPTCSIGFPHNLY